MADHELPTALRRRLFGGVSPDVISSPEIPRLDPSMIQALRQTADATCAVADALDALGVEGTVPASTIAPLRSGQRVCGQAITIRWTPYGGDPAAHHEAGLPKRIGDRDLYALAEPGDVAVVAADGHLDSAVIGDISLGFAGVAGVGGVVVDGAVRDAEALRAGVVPVWARGITPAACRYRLATAELNGPVALAGTPVRPGDLVVADGNGVCVVPFHLVPGVVQACTRANGAEAVLARAIREATSLEDLVTRVRGSAVL